MKSLTLIPYKRKVSNDRFYPKNILRSRSVMTPFLPPSNSLNFWILSEIPFQIFILSLPIYYSHASTELTLLIPSDCSQFSVSRTPSQSTGVRETSILSVVIFYSCTFGFLLHLHHSRYLFVTFVWIVRTTRNYYPKKYFWTSVPFRLLLRIKSL